MIVNILLNGSNTVITVKKQNKMVFWFLIFCIWGEQLFVFAEHTNLLIDVVNDNRLKKCCDNKWKINYHTDVNKIILINCMNTHNILKYLPKKW